MKQITEPWAPLAFYYYQNSKVRDAGPWGALCHQYVFCLARKESERPDGAILIEKWDAIKIWRWCGVMQGLGSRSDIEEGMHEALETGLVELIEDDGDQWVRPAT